MADEAQGSKLQVFVSTLCERRATCSNVLAHNPSTTVAKKRAVSRRTIGDVSWHARQDSNTAAFGLERVSLERRSHTIKWVKIGHCFVLAGLADAVFSALADISIVPAVTATSRELSSIPTSVKKMSGRGA